MLALLGAPADRPCSPRCAGWTPPRSRPGCGPAAGPGLLGRATEDGVPFAHALLQDGVRRSVEAATAAAWHRRAAEVLADRVGDRQRAGRRGGRALAAGRRRAGHRPAGGALRRAGRRARRTRARPRRRGPAPAGRGRVAAGRRRGRRGDRRGCWSGWPPPSSSPGGWWTAWRGARRPAEAAERAGRPDLVAAAALVVRGISNAPVAAVVERLCRTALAAELPDNTRARVLAQLASGRRRTRAGRRRPTRRPPRRCGWRRRPATRWRCWTPCGRGR